MAILILLALCRPASMSAASGAAGDANTRVASPVRSATVPLTSYQDDLVSRPNPMDDSRNRVITGNVTGGKHFRANVPYRSTTSLSAPLGSTSLDSFMRYTAATPTDPTGTHGPYYSPTGTATTTQLGTRSVLAPDAYRIGSTVPSASILPPSPGSATDSDTSAGDTVPGALPPLRLWPPSQTSALPGDGVSQRRTEPPVDIRTPVQQPEVITGDEYRRQMELLQERLAQIQADLAELEQGAVPDEEGPSLRQTLSPQNPLTREELLQETARLLAVTKASIPGQRPGEGTKLRAGATAIPENGSGDTSRLRLYEPGGTLHAASGTTQRQTSVGATRQDLAGVAAGQPRTPDGLPEGATGTADVQVSSATVRAFQRHLGAAEYNLDCGQYARAAESFALAATCLPNNARAHLGRSHALLAAGEYAASALALAEAIELDPQLALRQWDLVRIVGGPDAFINRFNELEKAAKAGRTPQLQLLLAYIYYQMERPQEAKVAIEIAYNAMPSSVPVGLLKAAIGQ